MYKYVQVYQENQRLKDLATLKATKSFEEEEVEDEQQSRVGATMTDLTTQR